MEVLKGTPRGRTSRKGRGIKGKRVSIRPKITSMKFLRINKKKERNLLHEASGVVPRLIDSVLLFKRCSGQ